LNISGKNLIYNSVDCAPLVPYYSLLPFWRI
jgi:hypothetical protein